MELEGHLADIRERLARIEEKIEARYEFDIQSRKSISRRLAGLEEKTKEIALKGTIAVLVLSFAVLGVGAFPKLGIYLLSRILGS